MGVILMMDRRLSLMPSPTEGIRAFLLWGQVMSTMDFLFGENKEKGVFVGPKLVYDGGKSSCGSSHPQ